MTLTGFGRNSTIPAGDEQDTRWILSHLLALSLFIRTRFCFKFLIPQISAYFPAYFLSYNRIIRRSWGSRAVDTCWLHIPLLCPIVFIPFSAYLVSFSGVEGGVASSLFCWIYLILQAFGGKGGGRAKEIRPCVDSSLLCFIAGNSAAGGYRSGD
jgi:hypothetical protein